MKASFSVRSHVGNVRENNEDNLFANGVTLPPDMRRGPFSMDAQADCPLMFAVCDGMGGEDNGEVASAMAVEKMTEINIAFKNTGVKAFPQLVSGYTSALNRDIKAFSGGPKARMGTTLAMVFAVRNEIYCFNVGDTRIYCLKRNKLTLVTNDHTAAAEKLRTGTMTAEQARQGQGRNQLTKCIGIGESCDPECYPPIRGSCRFLICSDGLTGSVSDDEIRMLMSGTFSTAESADALLNLALRRGGRDNITLIVCDISHGFI